MQLQSISAKEKVNSAFWPLINEAVSIYENRFNSHLKGVFLVGSVSRGGEVGGILDIDVIALIDRAQTDQDKDFLANKMRELKPQALALGLTKIDLVAYELDVVKASVHKQFMLRIDGIQLYGDDLELDLPFPEVGKDLAKFLNGNFGKNVMRAKELLDDPHAEDYIPARGRWISKKSIRLALGLVMVREKVFTFNIRETIALVKEEYKKLLSDVEVIYTQAKEQGICD